NFRFRNLPKDTFAIYALGEAGTVRRYQDKSKQYFAFADAPVVPGAESGITLYAYREPQQGRTAGLGISAPAKGAAAAEKRLRFTPPSGDVDLQSDFILSFQTPLRRFDSAQVSLSTDTTFTPAPFTTFLDTSNTKLHIRSQWKQGTTYNLILNKTFAEDTAGRQLLKTDTLNFRTKKLSDYGQLRLRINKIDTAEGKPVVQFVQNGQVVFSAPMAGGIFTSRLFTPGDYELRILYDKNGNGQWDPGQFFGEKRQPEIVRPVTQNITVKADWDNEFERSL
ncbi:MAG TPA: hypothetical protein VFL47_12210, partial [Flavisolibacter sp.]|nr:hypothetical protein [Flavisolibacter sp.]